MSNEQENIRNEGVKHESSDKDNGVRVNFVYLNSNEEIDFFASISDTLGSVWNTAYEKLEETKKQDDKLECDSGADLVAYLNLTLDQLHEKKICVKRKFQIRCSTGGA
jgi:hypothetical protein